MFSSFLVALYYITPNALRNRAGPVFFSWPRGDRRAALQLRAQLTVFFLNLDRRGFLVFREGLVFLEDVPVVLMAEPRVAQSLVGGEHSLRVEPEFLLADLEPLPEPVMRQRMFLHAQPHRHVFFRVHASRDYVVFMDFRRA